MERSLAVRAVVALGIAVLVVSAFPAAAGNGHLLHGVGAINSSMGGAGTGLPVEVLGALHLNPALLTQFDGHHVGISTEFFFDDQSATTDNGQGGVVTTASDGEPNVLPAVGWSLHKPDGKLALGWGLLAVAGFRANWPADPQSLLLAPQPQGFGALGSELAVVKVPFAFAYQVNDRLSVGASFNLYRSRLIINPLPTVTPDCNIPGTNQPALPPLDLRNPGFATCYRPATTAMVSEFGSTVQLGLYYEIDPRWSFGLSYTSELDTDPFEWNSTHANPNLANFGLPRRIAVDLDQPAIATIGVGFRPNPTLEVAFDVRWVGYSGTAGFGGSGAVNQANELVSLGWDDIVAYMVGARWDPPGPLSWRVGLNLNESPIRSELILSSAGAASVFEQHYTMGGSLELSPNLQANFSTSFVPERSIRGPFPGGSGATLEVTNSIVSALVGFSFEF